MKKFLYTIITLGLIFSFSSAKIDSALELNKKNEENVKLHKIFDMMNLAKKYQKDKNYDKEIEVLSNLTKEYGSLKNRPAFAKFIAMSYFNMADAYFKKGDLENALLNFDNFIDDFKDSKAEIPKKLVLLAYIKKIDVLKKQNRNREVIKLYYKLIDIAKEKKFYKTTVELGFLFEIAYLYSKERDFDNAIRVYNQIIEKYKNKIDDEDIKAVVFASMINKVEAKILSNQRIKDDVEEYVDYMYDDKKYLMQIDMLDIIHGAIRKDQSKKIKKWNEDYKKIKMIDYSFDWLEKWAETIDNREARERIKKYIMIFKNHKVKK